MPRIYGINAAALLALHTWGQSNNTASWQPI